MSVDIYPPALPTGAATDASVTAPEATPGGTAPAKVLYVAGKSGATAVPVLVDSSGNVQVGGSVSVSNFPASQPVSGTVTANQGTANATPWNENVAQIAGAAPSATNGLAVRVTNGTVYVDPTQIRALTSSDQVTIANAALTVAQATAANLLATVTQGPAGAAAWKVDGSAVTQPVSATALPLPAGAALDSSLQTLDGDLKARLTTIFSGIAGTQLIVQDPSARRWLELGVLELRHISVQLAALTGVAALGESGDIKC